MNIETGLHKGVIQRIARRYRGKVSCLGNNVPFNVYTVNQFDTRPFPCKEGDFGTEGNQDLSQILTWRLMGMFLTEQAGEN